MSAPINVLGTVSGRWSATAPAPAAHPRASKTPLFRLVWIVEFDLQAGEDPWQAIALPFDDRSGAVGLCAERIRVTGLCGRYRLREIAVPGEPEGQPPTATGFKDLVSPAEVNASLQYFPKMQEFPSPWDI